jgi:hypothetical protein
VLFASTGSSITANVAQVLIFGVNMLAVIPASLMLNKIGRKTAMLVWTAGCGVTIILMGILFMT